MSFRQDGNEICVQYEQQKLVVKAIRDDIVNIFVPYRTKEHYSKAIDGDKAVATELTAEQKGEDLVIATDKIRMQFGENLEMVITRPDGTPLVRTHRQGRSVCGEVSEQMKPQLLLQYARLPSAVPAVYFQELHVPMRLQFFSFSYILLTLQPRLMLPGIFFWR